MEYPLLDIIKLNPMDYPDELSNIDITIRGKCNLFDIYFSVDDIEREFDVILSTNTAITWISISGCKKRYLSYPSFKRLFFTIAETPLAMLYMQWVDSLLFGDKKIKPFFKALSIGSVGSYACSEIDDCESIVSIETNIDDSMQMHITNLQHELEMKEMDIKLLQKEIRIRDQEIELLHLRFKCNDSQWI